MARVEVAIPRIIPVGGDCYSQKIIELPEEGIDFSTWIGNFRILKAEGKWTLVNPAIPKLTVINSDYDLVPPDADFIPMDKPNDGLSVSDNEGRQVVFYLKDDEKREPLGSGVAAGNPDPTLAASVELQEPI